MSDIAQTQPVTNTMRVRMEAAIETLLALLDEMDGNPDLEEGADDEPYIGGYFGDDRELDTSDDEPYLSTGTVGWGVQPQGEVDAEGDPSEADCPGYVAGGQGA